MTGLRRRSLLAWLAAGPGVAAAETASEVRLRELMAQRAARVNDPRVDQAAAMADRAALLATGEAALVRGDTDAAQVAFERAAALLHAADTEMGLVRTWLQAGEYRRALAFCAHTAGGHREAAAPGALYAWLLRLGGQLDAGQRTLALAQSRWAGDAVVDATARQLASAWPVADGVLLDTPHRMAPQPTGDTLPAGHRAVASGVRVAPGRVLVPARSVAASSMWVRDGLGRAAAATVERVDTDLGIAVLSAPGHAGGLAARDPFAGSPGYTVAFSEGGDAAWPWLHAGFLGASDRVARRRRLGIDAPAGAAGGGVFNAAGQFAGLRDGDSWLPVSALAPLLAGIEPAAPATARVGADEVYENVLGSMVQLIVTG